MLSTMSRTFSSRPYLFPALAIPSLPPHADIVIFRNLFLILPIPTPVYTCSSHALPRPSTSCHAHPRLATPIHAHLHPYSILGPSPRPPTPKFNSRPKPTPAYICPYSMLGSNPRPPTPLLNSRLKPTPAHALTQFLTQVHAHPRLSSCPCPKPRLFWIHKAHA